MSKCGKSDNCLSPLQTLTASLGVTLGTGNIIALGAAIAVGGPGSLLYMVLFAMFGAATAYAETLRGFQYRDIGGDEIKGGAMSYISAALGKVPAKIYALLCLLASFGVGAAAQTGAASAALENAFGTPATVTGAFAAAATVVIIAGGAVFFGKFTEKVIPALSFLYLALCVIIIIMHIEVVPAAFADIFSSAFTIQSAAGGGIGAAFMWGVRRGVFSNEAGLGSSVFFTSMNGEKDSNKAACVGALSVFFDTVVVCSVTGLAILVSGAPAAAPYGELYANYAFAALPLGNGFLAAAVAAFALCTCSGWAVFGMKSAEYIFGKSRKFAYALVFAAAVYGGAVIDAPAALGLADIFNGLMAVPNLLALFVLEIRSSKKERRQMY
jgi:AGCS family alanine or glycine:cation symporter